MTERFRWKGRLRPVEIIHLPGDGGWTPLIGSDIREQEWHNMRRERRDEWKLIEAAIAEGGKDALDNLSGDLAALVRHLLGLDSHNMKGNT